MNRVRAGSRQVVGMALGAALGAVLGLLAPVLASAGSTTASASVTLTDSGAGTESLGPATRITYGSGLKAATSQTAGFVTMNAEFAASLSDLCQGQAFSVSGSSGGASTITLPEVEEGVAVDLRRIGDVRAGAAFCLSGVAQNTPVSGPRLVPISIAYN